VNGAKRGVFWALVQAHFFHKTNMTTGWNMSTVDLLALCILGAHLAGIGGAIVWTWAEKRDHPPNGVATTATDKPAASLSLESRGR
jgi:tetrahydromethanopterin S-methyltransferase subunit D